MKTTYANTKQKLFAVTLTLATIISLAWINPAKTEKTGSTVSNTKNIIHASSEICLQDTTKKKNRKSVRRLHTDSVHINPPKAPAEAKEIPAPPIAPAAAGNIPAPPKAPASPASIPTAPAAPKAPDLDITVTPMTDILLSFSEGVKDMAMAHFNGQDPEDVKKLQAELQKKGIELQRRFNSPEQKAKWEKIAAEMKAKYDNPKERAKLEKMAKEAEAQANAPERKEMIRKIQIQAKMAAIEAQKMINDPEFRKNMQSITITRQQPMKIVIENENTQKVKETPGYIELKKKFDKDVEDLTNRKNKKDAN